MDKSKSTIKIKLNSNARRLSKKGNEELHEFLDLLHSTRYYGEITLYFQDGNFEHLKEISRISKKDLIKGIQKKETRKNKIREENILQACFPLFSICNANEETTQNAEMPEMS